MPLKRVVCKLTLVDETTTQFVERIDAVLERAGLPQLAEEFKSRAAQTSSHAMLLRVAANYIYDPTQDELAIERWLNEGGTP